MKRIDYRDTELLHNDYLQIFDRLSKIQEEWDSVRNNAYGFQKFPKQIENILLAKFEDLAKMYSVYKDLQISNEKDFVIRKIFNYKGYWRPKISDFFKAHSDKIGINICCYCETAYTNTYQKGNRKISHFDLDHFFSQNKCPILALSFYNFVPSCPICNERLKRNDILGDNNHEWLLLSPTSSQYAFDDNVKIYVLPNQHAYHNMRYQDNPDKFSIHFETNLPEYQKEIEMFHLNERYEFHKGEALRLLDLRQDYPDTNIKMISTILHRSEDAIREDIFHSKYVINNHRTLGKLYRDLLGLKSNNVKE